MTTPDPLAPYRASIQQLRRQTEELLANTLSRPPIQGSPLDGVHREIFAGIGSAVTGELFGRRRVGSSIGRAIAANSQVAQRQRVAQAARSDAGAVVQQARQVVDSISSIVGPHESRTLRAILARAEAAQRPDTILRRVLEVVGRAEGWQPLPPSTDAGEPHAASLHDLEREFRRCIERCLGSLTPNWWNDRIPSEVRTRAERRKSLRERVWPWLDGGDHPLVDYLDFPDYSKIILDSQNWPQAFSTVFVDPEALRVKLRELEPIRNDLAHLRPLGRANGDRLRLYSRELTRQMRP